MTTMSYAVAHLTFFKARVISSIIEGGRVGHGVCTTDIGEGGAKMVAKPSRICVSRDSSSAR